MLSTIQSTILKKLDSFLRLETVGVDISDRSIKLFKFRFTPPYAVDYWGEAALPAGLIEKGEIKDEGELISAFSSFFAKEKKKNHVGQFVVASLPEEKSFLRLIQLPKIRKEDIKNAVRWEIEANIPLPSDELLYDSEIIDDHNSDHLDVVISAFPKQIIEPYVRVLSSAGLTPVALELESQALLRAVLPFTGGKPSVVADIGKTRTSLIIFSGKGIMYTTTVEFGGQLLEENIVKLLRITPEEAELVKKEKGFSKTDYDGKLILALLPSLSALGDELKRTIEYFRNHRAHAHGEEAIRHVILTGGDARLRGIDTYLSSTLQIPVSIANPLELMVDRLNLPIPTIHREYGPAFSTAIGLALRNAPSLSSYTSFSVSS